MPELKITTSVVALGTMDPHQLDVVNQLVLVAPDQTAIPEPEVAGVKRMLRPEVPVVCVNLISTLVDADNTPTHKAAVLVDVALVATCVPLMRMVTLSSLPSA